MARVMGWSPTEMREREDAFAALVDAQVEKVARRVAAVMADDRVVTAAGGTPAPPVDLGSVGVITGLWHQSVAAELMPALSATYMESASVIWQGIGEAFDQVEVPPVSNSFAEDYLAQATNRLAGIGQVTWENIRQELLVGFALGEGITKLRDRVVTAGQVSQARANVIARTEVNAASNAGAHQQVLITGLTGTKEWLDTNDLRTRCTHKAAGGQTVDVRQKFTLGGPTCGTAPAYLDHPGDPTAPPSETIQCRCSVAYDLSFAEDENDPLLDPLSPAGALTAAANEVNTGGMVALMPTVEDANRMALTGAYAEPATELHTTLLFLGDASAWGDENRRILSEMIADYAATYGPIETETFSVNVFNPGTDDTAIVLGVRGNETKLTSVHNAVAMNAEDIFDDEIPPQHRPWIPHITLAYTGEVAEVMPEALDKLGPVTFDRIRVVFAGQVTDYPLVGQHVGTEPGDSLVAAVDPDWDESKVKRDSKGQFAKSASAKLAKIAEVVASQGDIWSIMEEGDLVHGDVIAKGHAHGHAVQLIVSTGEHGDEPPYIVEQAKVNGKWQDSDYWVTKTAFSYATLTGYTDWSDKVKLNAGASEPDDLNDAEFEFADAPKTILDLTPTIAPGPVPSLTPPPPTMMTQDVAKIGVPESPTDVWKSLGTKWSPNEVVATGEVKDSNGASPLRIIVKDTGSGPFLVEQELIDGKWMKARIWHTQDEFEASDLSEYGKFKSHKIAKSGYTPIGPLTNGNRDELWKQLEKGMFADGDVVADFVDSTGVTRRLVVRPGAMGALIFKHERQNPDGTWSNVVSFPTKGSWDIGLLADFGIGKAGVPSTKSSPSVKTDLTGMQPTYATADALFAALHNFDIKSKTVVAQGKDKNGNHWRLVAVASPGGPNWIREEMAGPNADLTDDYSWSLHDTYNTAEQLENSPSFKFYGMDAVTASSSGGYDPVKLPPGTSIDDVWHDMVEGHFAEFETITEGTAPNGAHWKLIAQPAKFGGAVSAIEMMAPAGSDPNYPNSWAILNTYNYPEDISDDKLKIYGLTTGTVAPLSSTSMTSSLPSAPSAPVVPTPPPSSVPTTNPLVMPTGPGSHSQLWDDMKSGKFKSGQVIGEYTDKNGATHELAAVKTGGKWGLVHSTTPMGGSKKMVTQWTQGKVGEMEAFVATDLSKFKKPGSAMGKPKPGAPTPVPGLTNAVIYGKYSDGDVIATLANPTLTKDNVQVRIVYQKGKILKQANVDGTGWKTVQTMGKGEAYKNLKGVEGPWYIGEVDAPGTGGTADDGEPLVTSPAWMKPAVPTATGTMGTSTTKPAPSKSLPVPSIMETPTTGTAKANTHLGLWQKVQAGDFKPGEVIGSFSTGMFSHELRVEKNDQGQWIIVHDKYNAQGVIHVNRYETTEDFLTAHIMDFQKSGGGKLVITLPVPKKNVASVVGVTSGGSAPAPVPPAQVPKIKVHFANSDVKWHSSSDKMLAAAIAFQKDNPTLTLGQILGVMDTTTTTKTSPNPFTDKIKKYVQTAKGKEQLKKAGVLDTLVKNPSGTTTTGAPLTPIAGITPSLAGHGIYHEGDHHYQAPAGGWETPTFSQMAEIQKTMLANGGPWTPSEKSAIQAYTATSTSMNNCLREPQLCTPYVKKQTEQATEGMRPLPIGVRTKRGTGYLAFPGADKIRKSQGEAAAIKYMLEQQGRVMVEPGFLSTSVGGGFGGDLRWQIDIPPGTPAAYVEGITKVKGEYEVLLPPGLKYRIKEVAPKGPGHPATLITLEVIYP